MQIFKYAYRTESVDAKARGSRRQGGYGGQVNRKPLAAVDIKFQSDLQEDGQQTSSFHFC